MLCEKPEEKETKAMGYTVQERYRSRWLSPISRYSHLCAGDSQGSGSTHRLRALGCPLLTDRETQAWRGEAQAAREQQLPQRSRSRTLDPDPGLPLPS